MNAILPKAMPVKNRPAQKRAALSDVDAVGEGVDAYLEQVRSATPMQMIDLERRGVSGALIIDLSERMAVPASRLFSVLRVPKATAARKMAPGAIVDGRAGQAAVGMLKLLGIARDIAQNSTADGAASFDTVKWMGRWIELPQAALGGHKPADLLDTPTGIAMVARLLGAIESGAYQ